MHAVLETIARRTPRPVLTAVAATLAAAGPASGQCLPVETAQLLAPDGASQDFFGFDVAASGDVVVVTALWDDDLGANSGSAWIFERDGGAWTPVQKLLASDGGAGDNFGRSVAIDGDVIVVGANNEDQLGANAGSAYVFERGADRTWSEMQKLLPIGAGGGDIIGWGVDVDGDTIVLSAHRDDDRGEDAGAAYVFERVGGVWTQQAKLLDPQGAAEDLFGHAVAVSGDTILVGAYLADDLGSSSGSVTAFRRDATGAWNVEQRLTASNGNTGYHFGRFIDLDGDLALIGSPFYWPLNWGAAYVLERIGGTWVEQDFLLAPRPQTQEWFASGVAIDGARLITGSFFIDGTQPGRVFDYARSGTQWLLQSIVTASDGFNGNGFGQSVALSGSTAVVGADGVFLNGVNSGAAYVFEVQSDDVDCNGDGIPDCTQVLDGSLADCNANAIPDVCDLADGTSADLNRNGVPDECEDCNGNGIPDDIDLAMGESDDCNGNGIPDECISLEGDCNGNAVPDACDLADGTSLDCDGDGVPDDCVAPADDCNGNGVPDVCDLADGRSGDCNGNGLPDECETDCDGNGVPDECDLALGTHDDCNDNGVPDVCDSAADPDCNGNGLLDVCEADLDGDGVPDDCEARGDVDGSGRVDVVDLQIILGDWGPCAPFPPCPPGFCAGDADHDCVAGVSDLLLVLSSWDGP